MSAARHERLALQSSVTNSANRDSPRLFLIDGSSYIFRAFYAVPPMYTPSGQPVNAIFGFTHFLLKFLKQHKPTLVAVALDAGRETFRHRIFSGYKKNRRRELPPEFVPQLPYFRRVLTAFNIPALAAPGYEADDIIATLCNKMRDKECVPVIVSSDKDLMQLVNDRVMLLNIALDRWISAADVQDKFGVEPSKLVEFIGLAGDPSDSIPGVKGIGAKHAMALIRRFENLENLYDRLDEVETLPFRGAARARKILEDGKDAAFLSRDLATARCDVPLNARFEDCKFTGFNRAKLRGLFAELDFKNLIVLLDNERL